VVGFFEYGVEFSLVGERRDAYRVLVGKPEGRRHLERPVRRWEDNIKLDFREVGWRVWVGGHRLD
jgi:hypothetical protein